MASSRVMSSSTPATTTTKNSDLQIPPQSQTQPPPPQINSCSSILIPGDHSKNLSSVTMDDILKNIYVDSLSPDVVFGNGDVGGGGYANKATAVAGEAVSGNDVWREIGIGSGMTLEEYLSKAGVGGGNGISEIARVGDGADLGVFGGMESANQFQQSCVGLPAQQVVVEPSPGLVIGNGNVRGKRKAVVEPVVDKATQQKQKRMIKNRESAARSRERKQQYTNELEKQVMQLEEERAQLLREEVEQRNRRRQWLIESIIPVEERQKLPRRLRRTSSMEWVHNYGVPALHDNGSRSASSKLSSVPVSAALELEKAP